MPSVVFAECHIKALYAESRNAKCHYAECRYPECHYAEGHNASVMTKEV